MINYNPKNWITLIFSFDKSDIFRMLWKEIIYIGLLSSLITFLIYNAKPEHKIVVAKNELGNDYLEESP